MDRDQQPQQRELVFCHQCENEWYRDEHGIICPECQSDFTEIIEADHDPRDVPDPDEDDIDDLHWGDGRGQPPDAEHDGVFTGSFRVGGEREQEQGQGGGFAAGLMGLIGPALQGLLGTQPQGSQGSSTQPQEEGQQHEQPQSPSQENEQGRRTFVRTGNGPGYNFTITTSTHILPRDANGPQPVQNQPEQLDRLMTQMMMNIGVPPGRIFVHGPAHFVPAGTQDDGEAPVPGSLGAFFHMFGDAVYSQQQLDRVITQLMNQHQSGNAPPPATEEAIESLSRRPITAKDQGDSGNADCSICMDEAEINSLVTELPCSHWFHHDCIKAWLKEHDTCPHCRKGITPRDEGNANQSRSADQAPLHDMHSPDAQQSRGNEYFSAGGGNRPPPSTNTGSQDARRSASPRSSNMFERMRDAFSSRDEPRNSNSGNNNGSRNDAGRS